MNAGLGVSPKGPGGPPARLRVGRHRHFLGAWDPAERLRIARGAHGVSHDVTWSALTEAEIAELGAKEQVDDATLTVEDAAGDAVVAAMTVPAKVRRQLWELDWDDEAETLAPRDQEAFAAYGRGVVAFFRAAGVLLGGPDVPCPTRLVALAPGTNPVSEENASAVMTALVNVGESDCRIVAMSPSGPVSLRVPSNEACLLARVARPYHVVVPDDAEFGLFLGLG
jgi:hypothetical protein